MQENRLLYQVRMVTIGASSVLTISRYFAGRNPRYGSTAAGERSDAMPSVQLIISNGTGARF